jgi:hypothetical protein
VGPILSNGYLKVWMLNNDVSKTDLLPRGIGDCMGDKERLKERKENLFFFSLRYFNTDWETE